jgi:alpha-L-fucosidase 2
MREKRAGSLRMFYEKPGEKWLDALPLGNGRIGAMVYGRANDEIIQLNETTFWSGEASKGNVVEESPELVKEIRKYLFNNDYEKARELCHKITGRKLNYGTNLPVGDMKLDFGSRTGNYTNFYRELDLSAGIVKVTYNHDDNEYKEEVFVSNPHQVAVVKVISKLPGKLGFRISFQGMNSTMAVHADSRGDLVISGNAFENIHSDGKTGVAIHGRIRVLTDNGHICQEAHALNVEGADSAVVLVALRTNFECSEPFQDCLDKIEKAAMLSYEELKEEHIKEHSSLMNRMLLSLGHGCHDDVPTDQRIERVRNGEADPGLDALLFNYGRYLIIGSSRENSPLPNHLQGIWNDGLACQMEWTCDMHLDINTQMNYWPTEAANLSECNMPLFKWISERLVPSGAHTAKVHYGCRGWTAHTVSNAWGYSAPGWGESWGIWPMGGVWIATHLWEHYLYTGDKEFLEKAAYPVLKGAAEFVLDYLVQDLEKGYLLSGPSFSPENSFLINGQSYSNTMGPTFDTVLSREIFNICIEAAKILDCDADFSDRLKDACGKLPDFAVGKEGQLQEWLQDFEASDPHHRHISHLLALYPFSQITVDKTPELSAAARRSIDLRVSPEGSYEESNWGYALLEAYFARLKDGNEAYKYIQGAIRGLTYDNLFICNPVFEGYEVGIYELDGNTGMSAAVLEMLLQSHEGIIELLPALPNAWDAGYVKGICARGGFVIDMEWENHSLKKFSITSKLGNPCTIKYKDRIEKLNLAAGETKVYDFNQI